MDASFFKERAEGQEHIINAGLEVFSKMGYKKASVADIAAKAGLAKGMITYYFGSKKNLYAYLLELSIQTIGTEVETHVDAQVTDYFEKIKMLSQVKLSVMAKYPALNFFLISIYSEKDPDVAELIQSFKDMGLEKRQAHLMSNIDLSKFKNPEDLAYLNRLIKWTSQGLVEDVSASGDMDTVATYTQEFFHYLDMLKQYFYQEDAL